MKLFNKTRIANFFIGILIGLMSSLLFSLLYTGLIAIITTRAWKDYDPLRIATIAGIPIATIFFFGLTNETMIHSFSKRNNWSFHKSSFVWWVIFTAVFMLSFVKVGLIDKRTIATEIYLYFSIASVLTLPQALANSLLTSKLAKRPPNHPDYSDQTDLL